jgi:hypothetical protein
MTKWEVVVRLYVLVEASEVVLAQEAARRAIAAKSPAELAVEAEYQALPFAGPSDTPDGA